MLLICRIYTKVILFKIKRIPLNFIKQYNTRNNYSDVIIQSRLTAIDDLFDNNNFNYYYYYHEC